MCCSLSLFLRWMFSNLTVSDTVEWRYMTVRINRTDQLIGSDWIRKANPERPTVGCRLPTEGCPPWVGRGLWRKMYGFSLHKGVPTIWEIYLFIFLESCWAYWSYYKNSAYGRHQLSWPMRPVGPIQIWRGSVIYLFFFKYMSLRCNTTLKRLVLKIF